MQAKRQVAGPLNLGGTLWRVCAQLAEGLFAPKAGVVVQKIVGAVGQLREDRIPGVSNRPHGEEGIKSCLLYTSDAADEHRDVWVSVVGG